MSVDDGPETPPSDLQNDPQEAAEEEDWDKECEDEKPESGK